MTTKSAKPTLHILLLLVVTSIFSACVFQTKTGGPCTYINSTEQAKVVQLHATYALLKNTSNQYEVKLTMFTSAPKIGDNFSLELNTLTQGSCTPVSIQSVKLNAIT